MAYDNKLASELDKLIGKTGYYIFARKTFDKFQKLLVVDAEINNVCYNLKNGKFEVTIAYQFYGELKPEFAKIEIDKKEDLELRFFDSIEKIESVVIKDCLKPTLNNLQQSRDDLALKIGKLKEMIEQSEKDYAKVNQDILDVEYLMKNELINKDKSKTKTILNKFFNMR